MPSYALHDDTGLIRQVISVPDDIGRLLEAGTVAYDGLQPIAVGGAVSSLDLLKLWHVVGGAVVQRGTMAPAVSKDTITADGADTATITGLPTPCTVKVAGPVSTPDTQVTDGTIEFTANLRGDYQVSVTAPPAWLDWSVTIHAV